ncbi:hypothetical protein J8Z80_11190 [Acinetobacter nosocomialis]|uniref:phage tail assembly protein T n=1 Tax=Acinetobacter nosocomialis TaxID=106654 RepID=UPI001AE6AB13|nr:hypothetical protein [Acinetobacter nosocomialis]
MTYHEYQYWQAFNILEPIGMQRENVFQANIAKTVFDVNCPDNGFGLSDFLLFQLHQERTVEDVMDDIKARMASMC